jgi:hypothetical protein
MLSCIFAIGLRDLCEKGRKKGGGGELWREECLFASVCKQTCQIEVAVCWYRSLERNMETCSVDGSRNQTTTRYT